MKRIWKWIKKKLSIVVVLAMLVFAFLSFFLIKLSHNINKEIVVGYNEKSSVDYKVYLKKNSFFETPYLEKNGTYITSLIDYVLIDYNYVFEVDDDISGNYTYYVKGTASANKSNSEKYYWSKDYLLTEKVTKNYEKTKKNEINVEVKVDYQLYNDLLNNFKSQYGVSFDGLLNVSLVIENNIESDLIDRKINKESEVELNIPLTSLTIEVPIETNELNNSGILISKTIQQMPVLYTIIKYIGYFCVIVFVCLLSFSIYMLYNKLKGSNKYNKTLNKILKTYDNIIVNTSVLPNTSKLNVINVTSFDELIDAHGEVRKPINYVSKDGCATFVLINDNMAWRYDLKKSSFRKKKGKK